MNLSVVSSVRLLHLIFPFLILVASSSISSADNPNENHGETMPFSHLSFTYYHQSCPDLEAIIHRKVNHWIQKDYTLAASLLRLHFRDCAFAGCDASILLNHAGSERTANGSKTLRGFEVIDDIKAEVEAKCPKTVSCADILTAAARDATVRVGGPFWMVSYGRKDGLSSVAREADMAEGQRSVTQLVEFYQSRGLNILDLVVLSGAHSIGRATCGSIQSRLYNFNGTGKADPSINPKYLNYLRRKCRWGSEYVDLDATTPTTFDAVYYRNLQHGMGLLRTDQLLNSDSRTLPLVTALASSAQQSPLIYHHQFAASMVKLGNVQVLTGEDEGQIRVNCNYANPRAIDQGHH